MAMLQLEPGGLDVWRQVDGGSCTWRAWIVPGAKRVQSLCLGTWSTAKMRLAPTEIGVVASGGGGASNEDKVKCKVLGLRCNL